MNHTRVVAAVISQDGRFLLCRRPLSKRHGGLWEFPGGKVEAMERHEDAIARELMEELGVRVTGFRGVVFSRSDPNSNYVIDFALITISGEPEAVEHEEVKWVERSELAQFELAPSDRIFVEEYLNIQS